MKRTYSELRLAMALDERLVGIIAGCISAGVVLIIAIIILVYCLCRKTRREKEMKQVERKLSTGTLGHSDLPSTLPKVSSNGLWIPSQSMLSAAPSTAYAQAKPGSKQRDILYRATSEPRLMEGKGPTGGGYQGNLRIYHSQQLAPLYEVYEPGRYDRYMGVRPSSSSLWEEDRMYHSQAMLIENGYQMNHVYEQDVDRPGRPRVRRSASDATSNSQKHKQREREMAGRRQPYPDKNFTAVVEVHQPRGLPVRSHWGQNRGPNKERQPPSNKNKMAPDYVADHSLTRKAEIPSDQLTRQAANWEPPTHHYHTTDGRPSTTIYSPGDRDPYQPNTIPRYQDSHEENFKLELKTTYSSQSSSRPASVDQGVQVGPDVTDGMASASANNTVSSKHTDVDEDGGYFTSSGRTDITLPDDHNFHVQKPAQDVDVTSDVTDLASKGNHVTTEAFEFLDLYLSDVSG